MKVSKAGLGVLLMLSASAVAQVNTLTPFSTDGCSMMLDGLPGDMPRWRHCCVAHDFDYWLGGTEAQRELSDRRLERCISEAATPVLGNFVYSNVRWGGSPYWITTYRWGYGWPWWDAQTSQPRGYMMLTDAEQQQVERLIGQARLTMEREREREREREWERELDAE